MIDKTDPLCALELDLIAERDSLRKEYEDFIAETRVIGARLAVAEAKLSRLREAILNLGAPTVSVSQALTNTVANSKTVEEVEGPAQLAKLLSRARSHILPMHRDAIYKEVLGFGNDNWCLPHEIRHRLLSKGLDIPSSEISTILRRLADERPPRIAMRPIPPNLSHHHLAKYQYKGLPVAAEPQ